METTTISITRIFDAPRKQVWKTWTEPGEIRKWWGPKDFTAPHIKNDLRAGGNYLYAMHGPAGTEFDQDMWSGGTYREVIPMEKIVATDHFADADGNRVSPTVYGMSGDWPEEMLITVTFEDTDDGKTRLTIMHEGHPAAMAEMAEGGWNESLDKLEAALA